MDATRFRGAVTQIPVTVDLEDDLSGLCKALGHPVRIRLIGILLEVGGSGSGELAEEFALAHSTVSEHLRILREVGLLDVTATASRRQYKVNQNRLTYLKSLIAVL
ncbi:MAG: winged helix-turn-helix transcriptional regulator [Deltaproteobacteria bacterium]|nr:winged helix-turn-helix transcriptional regulator [Deltaproteobacteria bacterium]